MMLQPTYPLNRIRTLDSFSLALGLPHDLILRSAGRSSAAYRSFTLPKKDGKRREVFEVLEPLKTVLQRIQSRILSRVLYPAYLHGSIKGRSAKTNVESHIGANSFIGIDIKKFFDSVQDSDVRRIWAELFRFGSEVSDLLTTLTTRYGSLPQGAPTSPSLANLVFWKDEWKLVNSFGRSGYVYTRYVDDIAVSSRDRLDQRSIDWIFGRVRGMLNKHGLRTSNRKSEVFFAGDSMVTTGLLAGTQQVSMTKKDRLKVRAAVHNLILARSGRERTWREDKVDSPDRTKGRLAYLEQFHPTEAKKLREVLDGSELISNAAILAESNAYLLSSKNRSEIL